MMRGCIHNSPVVPIHTNFTTYALRIFDTNPFGLFSIRQVGVIHHPQQITDESSTRTSGAVPGFTRVARRKHNAGIPPTCCRWEIMNLKYGVVVSQRYSLANIRIPFNQAS